MDGFNNMNLKAINLHQKLIKMAVVMVSIMGFGVYQDVSANTWCKRPKIDGFVGSCYDDGLSIIRHNDNGQVGFANKRNQIVITPMYQNADRFINGLAAVQKDDLWGVIDKDNQVIVPFVYEYLNSPDEKYGWIRAKQNGKWGVIDRFGNQILEFEYDDNIGQFFNERAYIKKDGKYGYVDPTGRQVIGFDYDNAQNFIRDIVCLKQNNKHGCIDKNGIIIIPFIYDNILAFESGKHSNKIQAILNDEIFYFNQKGDRINIS